MGQRSIGRPGEAQPAARSVVAIGFYGTTRDKATEPWRPTLDLCSHAGFPIHRLVLLHYDTHRKGAERLKGDIEQVSQHRTAVELLPFHCAAPFDHRAAYEALRDAMTALEWKSEAEEYLIHSGTGTEAAQAAWLLLLLHGDVPARLVQALPPIDGKGGSKVRRVPIVTDLRRVHADILEQRLPPPRPAEADALPDLLTTTNPAMTRLLDQVRLVATRSTDPVLLRGETGVGKTSIARAIWKVKVETGALSHPDRFQAENCANLAGSDPKMVQSALFGHEAGAFPGAKKHVGLLERAHGGVVFLDEIATLDLHTQAMLLTALESGEFRRVGGTVTIQSDFRLIAATNESLEEKVAARQFRQDLYSRVAAWQFVVPPLRERPEDLSGLIDGFLSRFRRETKRAAGLGINARKELLRFARSYPWPGNVRELQQLVRRLATLADGKITAELVRAEELHRLQQAASTGGSALGASLVTKFVDPARRKAALRLEVATLEEQIRICLEAKTKTAAARACGFRGNSPSNNLTRVLAKWGLTFEGLRSS